MSNIIRTGSASEQDIALALRDVPKGMRVAEVRKYNDYAPVALGPDWQCRLCDIGPVYRNEWGGVDGIARSPKCIYRRLAPVETAQAEPMGTVMWNGAATTIFTSGTVTVSPTGRAQRLEFTRQLDGGWKDTTMPPARSPKLPVPTRWSPEWQKWIIDRADEEEERKKAEPVPPKRQHRRGDVYCGNRCVDCGHDRDPRCDETIEPCSGPTDWRKEQDAIVAIDTNENPGWYYWSRLREKEKESRRMRDQAREQSAAIRHDRQWKTVGGFFDRGRKGAL